MGLMSLAAVGKSTAASRVEPGPEGGVSFDLNSVAHRQAGALGKPTDEETKSVNAGSLQRLVEFIPVESITLFWLAIPFAKGLEKDGTWKNGELIVYFAVFALTPFFLLLVYLRRKAGQKVDGKKPPFPPFKEWPTWRAAAATIAFAGWALAVPGSTIIHESEVSTMGLWVLAFVVSTVLSLLDPIMLTWVFPSQNPEPAG